MGETLNLCHRAVPDGDLFGWRLGLWRTGGHSCSCSGLRFAKGSTATVRGFGRARFTTRSVSETILAGSGRATRKRPDVATRWEGNPVLAAVSLVVFSKLSS
jgi:hypothetical protein